MKRAVLLTVGVLLAYWLLRPMGTKFIKPGGEHLVKNESIATNVVISTASTTASVVRPGKPLQLLGETILHEYANTNLPPENDLTLMSRLMENSLLLLKAAANRPLSANEDWADLFRGKNSGGEHFLPDHHVAINEQGQLVDRWRTPLFFHALGGGRYELRSAGPDKKLWTMDDIHRNSDGSFRRGSELNPSSLMDTAGPRRTPGR